MDPGDGDDPIELPDGRRLVVRPGGPGDAPALAELFGSLSPAELRQRFFSAFRPGPAFLDHTARAGERGGACLVAEVGGPGPAELVAEADFEPLADGDAELSMVVRPDWRGWLAPYLLDLLVREAARRGIPNLQAEVLTGNRPMLSLLRSRGHAVLDHDDWTTRRVTISTAQRVPTWPSGERPRVLVEVPGAHWQSTGALQAAGYDVIACPGPGRGPTRCPLLRGQPCPLVEGADVVVFAFRAGDAGAEALLEAHRGTVDRRALVVEVRGDDEPPGDEPDGAVVLRRPAPADMVAAVEALLEGAARHPGRS